MDCRGPDNKARKVYKDYEVTAEFINLSDTVLLKLVRRDATKKVSRHDLSALYEENDLYTIEFGEEGLVVISNKARRAIQLQNKTKKTNSRLIERMAELNLNNNSLKLTFLHFNNGIFVAEESFELYR